MTIDTGLPFTPVQALLVGRGVADSADVVAPTKPVASTVRPAMTRRTGSSSRPRAFGWAWPAVFWLAALLALERIGSAVAKSFDSALLGFLAADFILLLVLMLFTSGADGRGRGH